MTKLQKKKVNSLKILVTGATGFIGGELLKYLINQDQYSEIRVIARDKTKLSNDFLSPG